MTTPRPSAAICGTRRLIGRSRFVCVHRGLHMAGRHYFIREVTR